MRGALLNEDRGGSAGNDAKLFEDAGRKNGSSPSLALDTRQVFADFAIDGIHLGDTGLPALADKGIAELTEYASDGVIVN